MKDKSTKKITERFFQVSLFCLYISKLKFYAGFKISVLPCGLNAIIYCPSFSFGILKPALGVGYSFYYDWPSLYNSDENNLLGANLGFWYFSCL